MSASRGVRLARRSDHARHHLDFPGSQAALWICHGERSIVDLCEWTRNHGGAFRVAWRYDDNGPEIVANTAYPHELRPIGPVARALLRLITRSSLQNVRPSGR